MRSQDARSGRGLLLAVTRRSSWTRERSLNGLLERIDGGFSFTHQYICPIAQFPPPFYQGSGRLSCNLSPAPYFCWKHRAGIQVHTYVVEQFRITLRT